MILGGTIISFALLYLVGVNGLLNSGLGRRWMNAYPDVVRIRFDRAWTVWPGRFHVRGADISGQDADVQFEVTAEEAEIRFSLRGVTDKRVSASHVRGHGFTVYIRRRLQVAPSSEELALLPAIRFFPSPLVDDKPAQLIAVSLEDVDVQGLREVWIDRYRLLADVAVKANLFVRPRKTLRLYPADLIVHGGSLTEGGRPVASLVEGTVHAEVAPLSLVEVSQKDLAGVMADIELNFVLANLHLLAEHIPQDANLKLTGGGGPVAISLKLDHGVLDASSTLQYSSAAIHLTLPLFRFDTTLQFRASADTGRRGVTLVAELGGVTFVERLEEKVRARSKSVIVRGTTTDLDLSHHQEIAIHLDIPHASASDLTFLNRHIPADTAAHVDAGAATLEAHLDLDSGHHRASGSVDVKGQGLSVRNKSAHLRGDASIHAAIHQLDLESYATDLSGSHFSLEDVTIRYEEKETRHWGARLDLPSCLVEPHGHHLLVLTTDVKLKNLQPVMSVVSANLKLPWIVRALSDREDVRLRAHIDLGETTLDARELSMDAGQLSMAGRVRVTALDAKKPLANGAILIKLGELAVGLDIVDSDVKPILYRPTNWFAERAVEKRAR